MLNLGPIINQGNPRGRGVSGLGNLGRGRGLEVQEIRKEGGGGQKLLPSVGGVWDFFWNNPNVPITLIERNRKISQRENKP